MDGSPPSDYASSPVFRPVGANALVMVGLYHRSTRPGCGSGHRPEDGWRSPMKLGIHFVNFNLGEGATSLAPILSATARAAEEGGRSGWSRSWPSSTRPGRPNR